MITTEIYKGIEFVRITNMPAEQQQSIFQTLDRSKIIKILRDKELLNDCIQVADYSIWMAQQVPGPQATVEPSVNAVELRSLNLAFK